MSEHNVVLVVEGADDEIRLFKKILALFPEINVPENNILVFNTNLWVLNDTLTAEFGNDWQGEDIDFRTFLQAKFPEIKGKKVTDIFLVFDYERQDPRFDASVLEKMCEFFCDSVENGKLYINYPMVESFRHLTAKPLPDDGYKERKCRVSELRSYKKTVGAETKYQDYRKLERGLVQQIIEHNIKKASFVTGNTYQLDGDILLATAEGTDHLEIVRCQNSFSSGDEGFVYVLCTCVFFVTDYNSALLTKI